jgi:hypothetical protein
LRKEREHTGPCFSSLSLAKLEFMLNLSLINSSL